jgi:hypothetical protein
MGTKNGHTFDVRHPRIIEKMELKSLLVYDMKN